MPLLTLYGLTPVEVVRGLMIHSLSHPKPPSGSWGLPSFGNTRQVFQSRVLNSSLQTSRAVPAKFFGSITGCYSSLRGSGGIPPSHSADRVTEWTKVQLA